MKRYKYITKERWELIRKKLYELDFLTQGCMSDFINCHSKIQDEGFSLRECLEEATENYSLLGE